MGERSVAERLVRKRGTSGKTGVQPIISVCGKLSAKSLERISFTFEGVIPCNLTEPISQCQCQHPRPSSGSASPMVRGITCRLELRGTCDGCRKNLGQPQQMQEINLEERRNPRNIVQSVSLFVVGSPVLPFP